MRPRRRMADRPPRHHLHGDRDGVQGGRFRRRPGESPGLLGPSLLRRKHRQHRPEPRRLPARHGRRVVDEQGHHEAGQAGRGGEQDATERIHPAAGQGREPGGVHPDRGMQLAGDGRRTGQRLLRVDLHHELHELLERRQRQLRGLGPIHRHHDRRRRTRSSGRWTARSRAPPRAAATAGLLVGAGHELPADAGRRYLRDQRPGVRRRRIAGRRSRGHRP